MRERDREGRREGWGGFAGEKDKKKIIKKRIQAYTTHTHIHIHIHTTGICTNKNKPVSASYFHNSLFTTIQSH
jgi:hypothetical protein